MRSTRHLLMLMAASAFLASAQIDPPGRVGRLSYMSGDVSFRPGDLDDWVSADINRPLTTGDHLWTDQDARAEMHVGNAAIRLHARTAFEFLNLNDDTVQIRLAEGSLNIRLRSLAERELFEIDTPNLAFTLLRPGEYRIDVDPDRQTTLVTVRGGDGEITGGGQAFAVHAREQAQVSGGDSLSYSVLGAPPLDDFDNWCLARDRREDQSQSARYVSREMVGYQDLDEYGTWREVSEYGAVWVPRTVAAGWAPYHFGHWVWVEPWGWTWVDDAPWGFAPFHYGRWVYVGYWAWVPGPIAVRPVYAPALVAWVGGPRFSLSVSFGGGVAGVGWFPLGPREVYVPAYRASGAYINRVNVTNTTIVNNINITNVNVTNVNYINRNAPGAVTAVPQTAFGGRRVQDAAVAVRADAIRNGQVMNAAPVAPTRASVLGASASGGRVAQPPAAVQNRTVVAKTPPPPPPVPFAQRQQALSQNPGRPLDSSEVQQIRSTQGPPARTFVRPAQSQSNAGAGGGFIPGSPRYNPPPPQTNTPPPPGRVQRDDTGPPRVQRDSPGTPRYNPPPPQQNTNQPPPRVQRDVAPTQQNTPPPPPRVQQDVRPAQQNTPPPPRVQQDVRPAQQNTPPPPRVQQNTPPPPRVEREVQQERRQERQADKEVRKEEKKEEKKDDRKKQ